MMKPLERWAFWLNIASAGAAIVAAFFWFKAAGPLPPIVSMDFGGVPSYDPSLVWLQHTAVWLQHTAALSARAALFAAISACLFAGATLLNRSSAPTRS